MPKHPKPKRSRKHHRIETYGSPIRQPFVVPPETYIALKYVTQFTLNPTVSSTDNYVFRANSLYDPDYTGTGHQPYGYDQWATFYSSWAVMRTNISFTCTPPNLSTSTPQINNAILYIVKRRTDPTAFTSIDLAIEDPYCATYVMTSGYQRQPRLHTSIDSPAFLGVNKTVYTSSSEYSGGTGSNPSVQTFLICGAGTTLQGTNDPDPMYCTAELVFHVKFYNPANLAGSSLSSSLVKLMPRELPETVPPPPKSEV